MTAASSNATSIAPLEVEDEQLRQKDLEKQLPHDMEFPTQDTEEPTATVGSNDNTGPEQSLGDTEGVEERTTGQRQWIWEAMCFVVVGVTVTLLVRFLVDPHTRVVDEAYLLDLMPQYTLVALNDTKSVQSEALQWLLSDPSLQDYPDERLLQRFALATLLQQSWSNNNNSHPSQEWLNYNSSEHRHECEWIPMLNVPTSTPGNAANVQNSSACGDHPVGLYQQLRLARYELQGTIPPEIALLSALKTIVLSGNNLVGSLPSELGTLTQLGMLVVSNNAITGSLPTELGLLSRTLSSLDVSHNSFTGLLPGPVLANMTQLTDLMLGHNRQLPASEISTELTSLVRLERLSLAGNRMTGTIPSQFLAAATHLKELDLSNNQLGPDLPGDLAQRNNNQLKVLRLDQNSFSSTGIPTEWARLSSLRILMLAHNRIKGSLPGDVVRQWTQLQELYVNENSLTGSLPSELSHCRDLQILNLESNRLNQAVPTELGLLSELEVLHLSNNTITGALPSELSSMTSLRDLDIHSNELSGNLPTELGALERLLSLSLYDNSIRGPFPSTIGRLTALRTLALHTNKLSNALPSEIGLLRDLETLSMSENFMTGTLPTQLGELSALEVLSLAQNGFFGGVPEEVGRLNHLSSLRLFRNSLTGSLPVNLGNLSALKYLSLQNNQLTGRLSSQLGLLSDLKVLSLGENSFSGSIPTELGLARSLVNVGLSKNNVNGTIPTELGMLQTMVTLQLDENAFESIPSELGLLDKSLMLLDVSKNPPLTQTIPSELGLLKELTHLVAHNTHLLGTVPPEVGRLAVEGALTNFHIQNTLIYGEIPVEMCLIREGLSFYCTGSLCGCDCVCGGQHVSLSVTCLETPELC